MQRKRPGYEQKARYSKERRPKPIIYIAGKGKVNKTEAAYFGSFSSDKYCIQFVQEGYSDPKGIVKKLKAKINDKRGIEFDLINDRAFCLIDTDCNKAKDEKIQQAIAEAMKDRKAPINILTSNPCFEIWFILHERYTERKYNTSAEVIDDLKRIREWKDYEKSDTDIHKKTIGNIDKAIWNAKKLEAKHISDGLKPQSVEFMPSTEIYKLAELLISR